MPTASVSIPPQAAELAAKGYRVISRRHRLVARIDRANWEDAVPGHLLSNPAEAEDQYRRCASKDRLVVSDNVLSAVPSSTHSTPTGFVQ